MNPLGDDTFIPDDDTPEEWLTQVFDVATLRLGNEQMSDTLAPRSMQRLFA
jgi:hypothetical protein